MREIAHGDTLVSREVGDAGQGFDISSVLSVTLDVNTTGLCRVTDQLPQTFRNFSWECISIFRLVRLWNQAHDLVQLDNDAGLQAGVLAVAVGECSAVVKGCGFKFARGLALLAGFAQVRFATVDSSLLSFDERSVQKVRHPCCKSSIGILLQISGLFSVPVALEVVHGRVDTGVSLSWPDTHARVDANNALRLHPLWCVVVQGKEEDLEHAVPEPGKASVVDAVEQEDEEPRLWSPGAECSGFRVVNEVPNCLPAVPFHRLYGCASQQLWGIVGMVICDTLTLGGHLVSIKIPFSVK